MGPSIRQSSAGAVKSQPEPKTKHERKHMTALTRQVIACAALAGMLVGPIGCKTGPTLCGNGPPKPDPFPPDETAHIVIPPTGNEGYLNTAIGQFTSGDAQQSCFAFSQGWDRYYSTGYFLGPNVSPPPTPNNYPNPD